MKAEAANSYDRGIESLTRLVQNFFIDILLYFPMLL